MLRGCSATWSASCEQASAASVEMPSRVRVNAFSFLKSNTFFSYFFAKNAMFQVVYRSVARSGAFPESGRRRLTPDHCRISILHAPRRRTGSIRCQFKAAGPCRQFLAGKAPQIDTASIGAGTHSAGIRAGLQAAAGVIPLRAWGRGLMTCCCRARSVPSRRRSNGRTRAQYGNVPRVPARRA